MDVISVSSYSAASPRHRLLCVDDDPFALSLLQRALADGYDLVQARSGGDALAALQYGGPFAALITDYEMPGLDGNELLRQASRMDPLMARVLVSGAAGLDEVAVALNDQQIHTFIRKPFVLTELREATDRAVAQHLQQTAERDVLQQTLHGAVRAIVGVLAISCPAAYGRGVRLQRLAADLAAAVNAPDRWVIETAALLQPLPLMTLSNSLVQRYLGGERLDAVEQAQVDHLPDITGRILHSIPRLDALRDALRLATVRFDGLGTPALPRGHALPMGARILRIVESFDTLESLGHSPEDTMRIMHGERGSFDPALLRAFEETTSYLGAGMETTELRLADVTIGMVFAEHVRTSTGVVLIARGQDVTPALMARIRGPWEALARRQRVRMVTSEATAN